MKKTCFFLLLSIFSLLTISCEGEEQSKDMKSFNSFIVEMPSFISNDKSHLDFTMLSSRILYDNGDKLYVNGQEFTLQDNGDHWVALGPTVTADEFYLCHANGTVSNYSVPTYQVSFNSNLTTTSGIVLQGYTTSNIVTLQPAFAVLVFNPSDVDDYTEVRVGFEDSKVPYVFKISAGDGSMSNITYLPQASSANMNYTMLKMQKVSNYYYVAVPINGSTVNTRLFIQYVKNGDSYQRVTAGQVSLEKGHVYVIPSEDMSGYAFDEDGASKKTFSVSSELSVKFSAGNLQCVPHTQQRKWRFAPHQYDLVSEGDNQSISALSLAWIDLFGYGTSGTKVGSSYTQVLPSSTSQDGTAYCGANLTGSYLRADWGFNSIGYGMTQSSAPWRTLTHDEWVYLLARSGGSKKGGATVNGVYGLVILPDDWTLPTGLSFSSSSNFTSNVYELRDWDKMEKAGAIFLPVAGYRLGTTLNMTTSAGYYWSSTASTDGKSSCLMFNQYTQNANMAVSRAWGCSVRLVSDVL